MSEWPQLDELKQVLNVESTDWDGDYDETRLTRLLAAAIEKVKEDVGAWDDYEDLPDDNLAQAALRMAELMALKPEIVSTLRFRNAVHQDPTYQRLLYGRRRAFGIA